MGPGAGKRQGLPAAWALAAWGSLEAGAQAPRPAQSLVRGPPLKGKGARGGAFTTMFAAV